MLQHQVFTLSGGQRNCVMTLEPLIFRQRLKLFVRWPLFIYEKKPKTHKNSNFFPCTYKFSLHLITSRVTLGTFEEKLSDAVLCFPPQFVWCLPPRCCLRWEQSLRAMPWSVDTLLAKWTWRMIWSWGASRCQIKLHFFWSLIIEFQLKLSFVVNNLAMLGQKKLALHLCIPLVVNYNLFQSFKTNVWLNSSIKSSLWL